jgi:branched-chain amino acid transport system ATP-binding protein
MESVLSCQAVSAGYVGVPVVRKLDLHVASGEVVSLLGPNGAGKTTIVLTIAGVLPSLAGEVVVLGSPVKGGQAHKVARRGVAFVPDDRALFFGLSAQENLQLGPRPPKGQTNTVDLVLEYFPSLKSRLKTRAGLLSGGEQQMLAIGRAIAGRPKALVIDELSLGLAPVIVKRILPVVRQIADDLGTAVLLVEQHVDLALGISDRAYVLNHGAVVLEGAAEDLRKDRHRLRASYMGSTE